MRQKWKKRLAFVITLVICIGAVIGAMAWLSGAFRQDQIEPGVLPVDRPTSRGTLVEVKKITRPSTVDLVGTVASELSTTIASRISANIVAMHADAGDTVTKGQLLIRLDDRDTKARVAQAQEVLRAAEASRDLAQMEVSRLTPLVEQRVASANELDTWKAKLQGAAADVVRAQEGVKEAQVTLSDTEIISPFDGVVIDRLAESGDLASPGRPLLSIYDPRRLRLEASVREAYIGRLDELRRSGRKLQIVIDAANRRTEGKIEQIVPAADIQSRSFLVKVQIPDSTGLYPGMFGRLRIPLEDQQYIEIPRAALREVGQVTLVEVADEQGTSLRAVRLGAIRNDRVEILAGLTPGEKVVLP